MPTPELKHRLDALWAATKSLDPEPAERAQWQEAANAVVNRFLDGLSAQPTYVAAAARTHQQSVAKLGQAQGVGEVLDAVLETMTAAGIATAGSGHLAFVPGGGLYIGAVADHVAATINAFSADSFSAPAAAQMHQEAVQWLTKMVGYGEEAWGDLTSGGSHATMTAFFVAREAHAVHPRDYERTCVYLTEHTHHCCAKALKVLFSDALVLREVPLKEQAMDPEALAKMLSEDKRLGLKPWMIVATAGTTNLGRVDPLKELAAISQQHQTWLHVDGACGGFFKLCPETAGIFAGIEAADSVVLDPHKGLFLPYGIGAVVFKNGELLRRSLAHTGVYLQDRSTDQTMPRSPMDYSLELTRPFRSLRLWLALKIHGEELFRQALEEKLLLAAYAEEQVRQIPELEVIAQRDLSIFAFRYRGSDQALADQRTRELLQRINQHPGAFLSSTIVDGRFVIRIAVLSFRTHLPTIAGLCAVIRAAVQAGGDVDA